MALATGFIFLQTKGVIGIDLTTEELLKYAVDNGMLDLPHIQQSIDMKQREELLKKHPYKIWHGKDNNWHTYLPTETGRIPRRRKDKKDLEDVIINYWKQQEENPTIKEVFSEWNDRRLRLGTISDASHLRYKQIFNQGYAEIADKRIKSTSIEQMSDFLEEQACKLNLSAKAFSSLKTVTRGIFKRAKKRKLISYNIEEAFMELDVTELNFKPTVKEDCFEVFDEEETDKIITYLKDNLDIHNLCILLIFATGIRIGEAVALKHEVFEGNTFRIKRTETRYTDEDGVYHYDIKEFPKTVAGFRTAIIPNGYSWIISKIKSANAFGEFVFTNNGERLHTNTIRSRLSRICKKLNIIHKSPHKIRKTYGTILLDNHVDQRLILDLMGHADIGTTENHYHRNRKKIDACTKILSDIPDFMAK